MIKFFDGGMGSMLNLAAGELPEKLNISDPERVFAVHDAYAKAGAQFITANTFGANSLKYDNVDELVKAGVALAKKAVFGYVSIDSVAGPSEILVIADETANPRYVAADLLSQAEHDEMASAILVTTSEDLAHKVSAEVDKFVAELSRNHLIITDIFLLLRILMRL